MKKTLALGAALLVATACGSAGAPSSVTNASSRPATANATAAATNTPQHSMSPAEMAAMYASPSASASAQTQATTAPATTSQPTTQGFATPTVAPIATAAATTAPATPAPAPTTAASGPSTTVNVTLTDAAIKLSTLGVASGKVTFQVTNTGAVEHELVILQTSLPQNAIPVDPTNAALVQEPGLLGKVPSLAPKTSGSITLSLAAGSYVLICNELAHYMALGMHTGFSVR